MSSIVALLKASLPNTRTAAARTLSRVRFPRTDVGNDRPCAGRQITICSDRLLSDHWRCGRGPARSSSSRRADPTRRATSHPTRELASEYVAQDLVRAREDSLDLRLAVITLHPVLHHIGVATQDLHPVRRTHRPRL